MNTQKPRLFQKLEIGVASPKQIREWAERFLPNGETVGEVTSWETVNYKTLKPEPNGLFCQKIFGPVVDFTCACGKKTTKADRKTEFFVRGFCPKCGVERTHSRVRRYRLGYIKLKQPVVHPLYASQRPSPLGLCLNWPTKRVQSVMRTSEFCCLPQSFTTFRTHLESTGCFQNALQVSPSPSPSPKTSFYPMIWKKTLFFFHNFAFFQPFQKISFFAQKSYQKNFWFNPSQKMKFFGLPSVSKKRSVFFEGKEGEGKAREGKVKVGDFHVSPQVQKTTFLKLKHNPVFFMSLSSKKKNDIFGKVNTEGVKYDFLHRYVSKKRNVFWKGPGYTKNKFFARESFSEKPLFVSSTPVPKTSRFGATFLSKKYDFFQVEGDQKGYYLGKLQGEFPSSTSGLDEKSKTSFSDFTTKINEKQKKKPRLFSNPKLKNHPIFVFNTGSGEAKLYGISYDATWRQVEEFQEFLFYLWEQSFYYESSIPYYAFTKFVETHSREIPRHEQSYAIQTGGFAIQHILSHLDLRGLQSEIHACSVQGQGALLLLKERILSLDLKILDHRKEIKRVRMRINRLQQLLLKWKRQLETFRDFEQGNMQPAWMILSYLPVLPPGLRPITSIRGELVVSDINSLYRKVLIRNKRIHPGANFGVFDTALSGSWLSWCYNVRQVQEAVDELLKTGSVESGRPLKSLLEGLKGKQGRFRQHLLGKRVDYSGRSVIVVGPELKIHECGLPKNMAIELFQPFLIQKLRKRGIVFTTTAAKALIAERKPIVWTLLGEILKTHPVLLNRAPTLHRLGIQAFLPQLSEGKAILLHPLVCPAFNADFDGDQMAVHVPLSAKTRSEALDLLWSRNNILAPASGQPLLLPTQDMVLGFYYLTCSLEKTLKSLENLIPSWKAVGSHPLISRPFQEKSTVGCFAQKTHVIQKILFSVKNDMSQNLEKNKVFLQINPSQKSQFFASNFKVEKLESPDSVFKRHWDTVYFYDFSHVKTAYDRGALSLQTPIWVKWPGFVQTFGAEQHSRGKENVLETRIELNGQREALFLDNCNFFGSETIWDKKSKFVRTTPGRVFMNSWIFSRQ